MGYCFSTQKGKRYTLFMSENLHRVDLPACHGVVGEMQGVPLATEPGISLIILPIMRILQRNLRRTTDMFLFISHATNVTPVHIFAISS